MKSGIVKSSCDYWIIHLSSCFLLQSIFDWYILGRHWGETRSSELCKKRILRGKNVIKCNISIQTKSKQEIFKISFCVFKVFFRKKIFCSNVPLRADSLEESSKCQRCHQQLARLSDTLLSRARLKNVWSDASPGSTECLGFSHSNSAC